MNRNRAVVMLIVAGLCGLVAMVLVNQMMSSSGNQEVETVSVLHAAQTLEVEQYIDSTELVTQIELPVDALPKGAITSFDQLQDRWVQATIFEGEPIVESRLAPPGAPTGLSVSIPEGYEAMSVPVDERSSVAGFILPGHRVDVRVVRGRGESRTVETVLQNIQVLASGQMDTRDGSKSIISRTVTLAVTPEQLDRLALAINEGQLILSLRRHGDESDYVAERAPEPQEDQSDQNADLLDQLRDEHQQQIATMREQIDKLESQLRGVLEVHQQSQQSLQSMQAERDAALVRMATYQKEMVAFQSRQAQHNNQVIVYRGVGTGSRVTAEPVPPTGGIDPPKPPTPGLDRSAPTLPDPAEPNGTAAPNLVGNPSVIEPAPIPTRIPEQFPDANNPTHREPEEPGALDGWGDQILNGWSLFSGPSSASNPEPSTSDSPDEPSTSVVDERSI